MTGMLPGESTSAALRRVIGERDQLAHRLVEVRAEHGVALVAVQAEMDEMRAERDAARLALKKVGEQRDLARAELSSAREELERLRAALKTKEKSMPITDGGEGGSWRRSSYCGTNACIAVQHDGALVHIRSTASAEKPLTVTREEFAAFVAGVKAGEFDQPDPPEDISGVVCTVTPTIGDGTVVRWYRSEIAAERRKVMVSASRNGVQVGEHLTNGRVPSSIMANAHAAWGILSQDNDADMSGWATHRRDRVFGGNLVRIEREATDG